MYCLQDSKDLAVIQLKKVLSLNPRFVQAHQLLALLYMDREDWERAERELKKCVDIDRNNIQTLRYMKEVEQMLMPDETVKQPSRRKKDEAVRYQSDNEMIIQPLSVKEPRRTGVSTLLNIAIGLIIGFGVVYFLVVPSAQSKVRNEIQQDMIKISNESDGKTVRIQELESRIAELNTQIDSLNQEIEGFAGEDGTLRMVENLQRTVAEYLQKGDMQAAADSLENISQNVVMEEMSESFRSLYQGLMASIGPELSAEYYKNGYELYRTNDYTSAIDILTKSVYYDAQNVDALYFLARAYEKNEDAENAIAAYDKVLEQFPDSGRVRDAKRYRDALAKIQTQ